MEKQNILNTLYVLQKVEIDENNDVLFYFGDIPSWTKNEYMQEIGGPVDFYEVFKINLNLDHADKVSLYWKVTRYVGEKFLIAIDKNKMNIWNGNKDEDIEQWNFFDDLDDEILILNYSKYNVPKNVQDWKNDYMKLEKRYYSLLNEKSKINKGAN
ncbi:hypothetical protein [Flavobacterium sp. UBA7680]|uniref:hypothetical protein n=1 Tax=Flavobacterium sp. UBA7680 TaxID=1946559 RepID=UPI0025BA6A5B|nr:hypothetical protein [Flavobacterium sp. UBA7680]